MGGAGQGAPEDSHLLSSDRLGGTTAGIDQDRGEEPAQTADQIGVSRGAGCPTIFDGDKPL